MKLTQDEAIRLGRQAEAIRSELETEVRPGRSLRELAEWLGRRLDGFAGRLRGRHVRTLLRQLEIGETRRAAARKRTRCTLGHVEIELMALAQRVEQLEQITGVRRDVPGQRYLVNEPPGGANGAGEARQDEAGGQRERS